MGEAKRRKESDPNYGRTKPIDDTRGLVICQPTRIEGNSLTINGAGIDPQELRFALLFWDRLVWPSSKSIVITGGLDEQFLQSARILTRPDYTYYGGLAQIVVLGQVQAYLDLEKAEPGVWALAQGENSFLWKDGFAEAGAGAFVELHRAIPIPRHDVPLAEILEFKVRRRDELLLLRTHLESFVSEIEESPDKPEALKKRITELDSACANLLTVSREWQFPVYLSNFKASFSLSSQKLLPAIGAGWLMAEPYGLTAATAAAAIAGASSTLEIKGDYGLRSLKRPKNPYRYAHRIQQEFR